MAPALYLDSLSGVVHWEGALEAEHLLRVLWSSLILSPGHLTVIITGIAIGQSLLLPIIIKKKDKADKTKIRFKTLPLAHLTWLLRGHCQGFSSGNKELTKHTVLSHYFCVGLGLGFRRNVSEGYFDHRDLIRSSSLKLQRYRCRTQPF